LSLPGAQFVSRQGVGLLLSRAAWGVDEPTDLIQVPVAEAYLAAWAGGATKPRIALSRGVYPATDRKAALAGLGDSVMRSAEIMVKQGQLPAGLSLAEVCAKMHIFYGHPDEVAAGLAADRVLPYATDLILQFNPAFPPLPQALTMMEQIATQIAPALGWRASQAAAR
jgi:alkanesulfonate monooxygenase SsuD/methylene tetrahydromethanopterin reductase-like flavin-dependent oxidoreductase (luciferase family)